MTVSSIGVSGEDVFNASLKIVGATKELSDDALILGCLATAITTCNPYLSQKAVAEGISEMSHSLSLWLSGKAESMVVN